MQLRCAPAVPKGYDKKMVYVIRVCREPLQLHRMNRQLRVGEVLGGVGLLDQMSTLISQVYAPMLQTTRAEEKYSRVMTSDIQQHFDRFQGVLQGASMLYHGDIFVAPLPELDPERSPEEMARDAHLVQMLNSAVTEWSKAVVTILERELEIVLNGAKKDLSVGPDTVIAFWETRIRHLTNVRNQLGSPAAKRIEGVLRARPDSQHAHLLPQAHQRLSAVHQEAQENLIWLAPLRPLCGYKTVYTSLSYPALLFDRLITLTLAMFDNIILDKSAGSKSGVYVDFYAVQASGSNPNL